MVGVGQQRAVRRHFKIEFLSWLNVIVPAESVLVQLPPWPLTLSNKRLLQMALLCLDALLGFHVRAIQPAQHTPCRKRCLVATLLLSVRNADTILYALQES